MDKKGGYIQFFFISSLLLITFLGGCQDTLVKDEVMPDFKLTKTIGEEELVTSTFKPIASPTRKLTSTITATATNIKKPVPTSTLTKIPTFTDPEAILLINTLLTENASCELPCVWGMIPGQTTWIEVQQFLDSFLIYLGSAGSPSTAMYIDYRSSIDMPDMSLQIVVRKNIITNFLLLPPGTAARYRLEDILARYGVPEEVYIGATTSYPVKDLLPFDLIIYYPKYGFSALFNYNGENTGSHLQVCLADQPIGPTLDVWDPQIELTLEDIYPAYFEFPDWPMLTVEEALGMDKEHFTQMFNKKKSTNCILTPVELWR